MSKRFGLTLLEVLISIFIMGIGMLGVLAMFPAAADMMGRAISNAQMAEGLVNARGMQDGVDWTSSFNVGSLSAISVINPGSGYTNNFSNNPITVTLSGGGGTGATAVAVLGAGAKAGQIIGYIVTNGGSGYTTPPIVTVSGGFGFGAIGVPTIGCLKIPTLNPNAPIPISTGWFNFPNGETPVFLLLDQYAALSGITRFNNIPIEVGSLNLNLAAGRLFTSNSDLILNKSGVADLDDDFNNVSVEREAKFTIAHFFTKPLPISNPNYIKRNMLVFKDRSQVVTANDFAYYSINSAFSTNNQLNFTVNANGALKTRQWVMITDSFVNAYPTAVDFFEINTVDDSGTTTTIEITPSLPSTGFGAGAKSVYLLKDVAKVIYSGY